MFLRPLELLLVVFASLSVLISLVGRWRRMGLILVAAAVVLAVGHLIWEGAHWQMVPAYAGVLVACGMALRAGGGRAHTALGILTILLLLGSVGCSYVLPIFELPAPTGRFAVGTAVLYLKDLSRMEDDPGGAGQPREVVVQLWYPAGSSSNPTAPYQDPRELRFLTSYRTLVKTHSRLNAPVLTEGKPFPVVLFNPGWHGRRTQNTFLTEDLASHGYVVAAIDHPYNARAVAFPDGRVIAGDPSEAIANPGMTTPDGVRMIWNKELAKWTKDERFVLDELAALSRQGDGPWTGRFDTDQVVAVGHSFGGAASVDVCSFDHRVRGAVNLDGWFFGALRDRGAGQPMLYMQEFHGVPTPTTVGANASVDEVLDSDDERDLQNSLQKFGGIRVFVSGAHHEDFSDQPLMSPLAKVAQRGTIPAVRMHVLVRQYVLAFVNQTLGRGNSGLPGSKSSEFPEVSMETVPAPAGGSAANAAGR